MEITGGEDRDRDRGTRMAMRFKIPSPLLEATRRSVDSSSTVILNPSSLDNLHLVKQAQPISGRINPHPDQDSDDPDPDPDPHPPPGFASAANTSVHPPPPTQGVLNVIYKECLKNHAANIGGHVVDGCGEFMPGGGGGGDDAGSGSGSETALKCAACNCHRNFHRKEIDGCEASGGYNNYPYNSARIINPPQIPTNQAPPPPISGHHRYQHPNYPVGAMPPARMMAFGGGGGGGAAGESSSEDLNILLYSSGGGGGGGQFIMSHQQQQQQQQPISHNYSPSKKRFRTKFTAEQKEKMHELAEHLGWKIQKQSEELVNKFCNEYGVKRQVFKVWMHNNKQAIKHKHNQHLTIS